MNRVAEQRQRLWIVPASPLIWAVHFMLCYVTAAIWCGRVVDPEETLWTVRMAIAVYTAVALAAIGSVGWIGYRAHALGSAATPHDDDSPEDRHRFIGFATLLLSGLSAIATIYTALVPVFIETCQ